MNFAIPARKSAGENLITLLNIVLDSLAGLGYPRVGGSLLSLLGQFVIPFVSARISYVSATYQLCISVDALSRS